MNMASFHFLFKPYTRAHMQLTLRIRVFLAACVFTMCFYRKDQFTLHDVVEYMYLALDKKFYDFNTLGPLDRSKATFIQKVN